MGIDRSCRHPRVSVRLGEQTKLDAPRAERVPHQGLALLGGALLVHAQPPHASAHVLGENEIPQVRERPGGALVQEVLQPLPDVDGGARVLVFADLAGPRVRLQGRLAWEEHVPAEGEFDLDFQGGEGL